jgi:hypothetical protein
MPDAPQPPPPPPPSTPPAAKGPGVSRSSEPTLRSPDYLAGGAAVAWPGLGHIVQGRTKRGVLAMAGVLGLFLYGLFIGGIDAVDSREDKIWYAGAAMVGPLAWGTDWVHQNRFKAYDRSREAPRTGFPGEVRDTTGERAVWRPATRAELDAGMGPPNEKGLGRLNEIAMLSVALAGMLNFIVFLDALVPGRGGKVSGRAVGVAAVGVAAVASAAEGAAS